LNREARQPSRSRKSQRSRHRPKGRVLRLCGARASLHL